MSNLLNSHDFGLSKVLSGYKLPCVTYVLFSPNLQLPAHGGNREEEAVDTGHHHRMWLLTHKSNNTHTICTHPQFLWVCTHAHTTHMHRYTHTLWEWSLILFSTWTLNCLAAGVIYHGLIWLTNERNKSGQRGRASLTNNAMNAFHNHHSHSTKLLYSRAVHWSSWKGFFSARWAEIHINISR